MYVDYEKDLVETRMQGKCTISRMIYLVVNIMHAIVEAPMFGLCCFGSMNSL